MSVLSAIDAPLEAKLPANVEAERAILGAVLIQPKTINDLESMLSVDDFSTEQHRTIYRAMSQLAEEGQIIEPIPLKDELRRQGALDRAGGLTYISELLDESPNIAGIDTYVDLVRDAATNRALIKHLSQAARLIGKEKARDLIPKLAEELYDLVARTSNDSAPKPIDLIADEVYGEIVYRHDTGDYLTGISSGSPSIDAYTLGYQRGVLTVCGGYTSVGKTSFGIDMTLKALKAPGNEKLAAFYCALEMTNKLLGYRAIANVSQEKLYSVRTGLLPTLDKVEQGWKELRSLKKRLHMTDSAFDIRQICANARQLKQQGQLDIMFVDYIQLVDDESDSSGNREYAVNMVGKSLLRLAKQLDIAVVGFAQLNDGVANREGHEPKMQDMRESRALNQHARTVMILNRPWLFDRSNDALTECMAELHILKNSEGRTGMVPMHFNAAYMQFEDGPCHPGCDFWREPEKQEAVGW